MNITCEMQSQSRAEVALASLRDSGGRLADAAGELYCAGQYSGVVELQSRRDLGPMEPTVCPPFVFDGRRNSYYAPDGLYPECAYNVAGGTHFYWDVAYIRDTGRTVFCPGLVVIGESGYLGEPSNGKHPRTNVNLRSIPPCDGVFGDGPLFDKQVLAVSSTERGEVQIASLSNGVSIAEALDESDREGLMVWTPMERAKVYTRMTGRAIEGATCKPALPFTYGIVRGREVTPVNSRVALIKLNSPQVSSGFVLVAEVAILSPRTLLRPCGAIRVRLYGVTEGIAEMMVKRKAIQTENSTA